MHVARAVAALRPCLVVIENVRGLLTSPAGSPGDVEPCPWCLGDTAGQPALRALGAVLGSLADLGYDAKWLVLRASDVGAPHRRERTFLAAWPAGHPAEDADQQHREERRQSASIEAEERGARPEPGRRGRVAAAADPEGVGRNQGLAEPTARQRRHDPAQRGGVVVADAEGQRHGHPGAAARGRDGGLPCRRWSCPSGRRRRRRRGRGPAMGSVRIRHHPMGEPHPPGPGPHGRRRSAPRGLRGVDAGPRRRLGHRDSGARPSRAAHRARQRRRPTAGFARLAVAGTTLPPLPPLRRPIALHYRVLPAGPNR
ncbi:DNA cytosine methyltransferase [Streptomyces sp. KL115B]|uniref:DNA cytosine methyltransferase n=1 Tax=Streptomyces sp. KL115B TaxID=3045154 RepID=UPI0035326D68